MTPTKFQLKQKQQLNSCQNTTAACKTKGLTQVKTDTVVPYALGSFSLGKASGRFGRTLTQPFGEVHKARPLANSQHRFAGHASEPPWKQSLPAQSSLQMGVALMRHAEPESLLLTIHSQNA